VHDLIVIGGGPAGLAATAYALGKRLDVILVCLGFGGKAGERQWFAGQIERERLTGEEAVAGLRQAIVAYPERIVEQRVLGLSKRDELFYVTTERASLRAPAVIIATGAQPAMLGVPNEQQLAGHGLGYSIVTHAHLAAGREVAVIGSTARALRGVAELVRIAERIALFVPSASLLDTPLGGRLRAHPKVHVLEGYQVTGIEADDGVVRALAVRRQGAERRIPVQAVFVAMGLVPNSQLVGQLVRLDDQGFIIVDQQQQTSRAGLFAAGDVTSADGEQILIAIGAGARAAQSAYDFILAQRLGLQGRALSGA
jgi:alkyl hydroperoxide reductase subunit F